MKTALFVGWLVGIFMTFGDYTRDQYVVCSQTQPMNIVSCQMVYGGMKSAMWPLVVSYEMAGHNYDQW